MLDTLRELVRLHPELAIFATMVLGHGLGKLEWRGIGLGSVVGTLVAGMLLGLLTLPVIPELLKWAFFDLFLFAVGYAAGPQFFASLKRETLPQMALAVVVAGTGLAAALLMVWLFRFDPGLAGGLVSGAMTQSAALGSSLNTLQGMDLPEDLRALWAAHAPLADATCYVFGEVGLILFLTVLAPRLLKIDLQQVAREAEAELKGSQPADSENSFLAYTPLAFRAYQVDNPAFIGMTVAEFEARFAHGRLVVQGLRRAGRVRRDVPLALALQAGDVLALASRRPGMVAVAAELGAEVDDAELLSLPMRQASIVLTQAHAAGKTLAELGERHGRGVFVRQLTRGQQQLPLAPLTRVQRGDVFHLTGSAETIAALAQEFGFVEPDPGRTDLVYLAGGIVVGTLLGLLQLHVGGVPLGLGGSGGVLVVGLLAGWLHSRYPVFGRIPESAHRLLSDVGLIVFIAAIGLSAGPHAVAAVEQGGAGMFGKLLLAGVVVTMAGPLVGLWVGHKLLKMPAVTLLPGIAGGQTTVATLNALKERGGSDVFAVGFTVPFAVSNVLITMWGPLIVAWAYSLMR